jgi:hypothetical protein
MSQSMIASLVWLQIYEAYLGQLRVYRLHNDSAKTEHARFFKSMEAILIHLMYFVSRSPLLHKEMQKKRFVS